jgi:tight adherence protein B
MDVAIIVFLGVMAVILGAYAWFVLRPEQVLARRLAASTTGLLAPTSIVRDSDLLASTPLLRRLLAGVKPIVQPVTRLVEQSRLPMTTATFLLATGCLALGGCLAATALTGRWWAGPIAAVAAGAVLPLLVRYKRAQYLQRFEAQLPDAVDLIARSLRAGHALTTGLEMVADELDAPIATEFRLLYEEQNYGLSLQQALRRFAERVPLLDARFFVTAVLTQRDAGGNLAEVLDNLASVIRERFRVRRQIRVISTHGRMTGWVLVLLPPGLAVGFLLLTENHMQMLASDPLGVRMILAAIGLQIIGTLIIRRIINVEY